MKKINKILASLLCVGICFTSIPTFAATTKTDNGAAIYTDMLTNPENASDYAEISGLTDEILLFLNGHINEELSKLLTPGDIDYSKAYKIFTGFGGDTGVTLEGLRQSKASMLIQDLEEAYNPYIWKLPIYADNQIIEVYINISKPLLPKDESCFTPEEVETIKAKVGQWHLSGYGFNTIDQLAEAKKELITYAKSGESYELTMTIGMPHFRSATALVSNVKTDTMDSIIPVYQAFPITAENLLSATSRNISQASLFNERVAQNQPLPYYETINLISQIEQ